MASAVGESYGKTVGGKLALKGLDLGYVMRHPCFTSNSKQQAPNTDMNTEHQHRTSSKKARAAAKKKKLKKKRKKEKKKEGRGTKRDRDDAALGSGDEEEAETAPLVQRRGTGRLVTSGKTNIKQHSLPQPTSHTCIPPSLPCPPVTSVHGKGTQFMKELTSGDAIMITHPTTFQQETRIITVVLSDISMAISCVHAPLPPPMTHTHTDCSITPCCVVDFCRSPFSSDLISATRFQYVKRPKLKVDSDAKQVMANQAHTAAHSCKHKRPVVTHSAHDDDTTTEQEAKGKGRRRKASVWYICLWRRRDIHIPSQEAWSIRRLQDCYSGMCTTNNSSSTCASSLTRDG